MERVNRTLKEATVRRYHYETHLDAYNFAKRLKTLRGLTPYEHFCKVWAFQNGNCNAKHTDALSAKGSVFQTA